MLNIEAAEKELSEKSYYDIKQKQHGNGRQEQRLLIRLL